MELGGFAGVAFPPRRQTEQDPPVVPGEVKRHERQDLRKDARTERPPMRGSEVSVDVAQDGQPDVTCACCSDLMLMLAWIHRCRRIPDMRFFRGLNVVAIFYGQDMDRLPRYRVDLFTIEQICSILVLPPYILFLSLLKAIWHGSDVCE